MANQIRAVLKELRAVLQYPAVRRLLRGLLLLFVFTFHLAYVEAGSGACDLDGFRRRSYLQSGVEWLRTLGVIEITPPKIDLKTR